MAEAMAIVGLVSATTSLLKIGARTIHSLHVISEKTSGAPTALNAIQQECTTIKNTLELLSVWINSGNLTDELRIASLHSSMTAFKPSMTALHKYLDQIIQKNSGQDKGKRGKFLFLWNEDKLKLHLDEVRWGNNALIGLLVATAL